MGYVPKDEAASSLCKHTRRYLLLPTYRAKYSKLLGCNGATLRAHIESLFTPGMSWKIYGRGAERWQMDHKAPLSKFDLHDPVQAAKAAHYTNVQPLWRQRAQVVADVMQVLLLAARWHGAIVGHVRPSCTVQTQRGTPAVTIAVAIESARRPMARHGSNAGAPTFSRWK